MQGLSIDEKNGSKLVSRQELDLIKIPEATDSYTPVSHFHLAELIHTVAGDVLKDYALFGESCGLARRGNQLFAILN